MTTSAICGRPICSSSSGCRGLDTDIARDDDRYLADEIEGDRLCGLEGSGAGALPHPDAGDATRYVIQYPPGTGFVLALFPEGFQVIPLYVIGDRRSCSAFAILAITSRARPFFDHAHGRLSATSRIYLMINPTKASYSMAPTMVVCALAGFLTARLFVRRSRGARLLLAGADRPADRPGRQFQTAEPVSVVRLFLFFLRLIPACRESWQTFLQGALFGAAFLVGMAPTLLANAINAGSPFSDDLRRRRRDAARSQPQRDLATMWPTCNSSCWCWRRPGRSWMLRSRRWQCGKTGRARDRRKSAGEPGLLHEPPHFHALLYNSGRYAFAVDPAVCTLMLPAEAVDGGLAGQAAKA